MDVTQAIIAAAQQYGVDPNLALAVAQQESGLNQNAKSSAGAIGIFQLLPSTAAGLNVNPNDATQNIQGGVMYLAQLIAQFGGNLAQALGAYNWGMGNVARAIANDGGAWLSSAPAETQNYVASILGAIGYSSGSTADATSSDSSSYADPSAYVVPSSFMDPGASFDVAGVSVPTVALWVGVGLLSVIVLKRLL